MPSLGPMEMLVIFVVALLVLGPAKLPEAGRQVGRAMAEFRKWSSGVQSELRDAIDLDPPDDPVAQRVPDTEAGPEPRPPSQFPEGQSFS